MLRILLAALTFPIFLLLSFVGKHFPHGQTFSPSLLISPSADMTTYYICSQHHILIQSECVMPIKKTGTVCVCHCMTKAMSYSKICPLTSMLKNVVKMY